MKILLIEPAKSPVTIGGEDVFLYEPLALEYVAAGVCADHEVRILDMRLDKRLDETLSEFAPDVVGVTSYTVHVNSVRRLFDQVKRSNPEMLTVVGGHHATVAPQDFVRPSIDLIVLGEGVFPFQEIVRRREKGEGFDGIPGVAFAGSGGLVKTDPAPQSDLDAMPFPNRSLTAQYRSRYFSQWMKPLASLRTSKGCPYRCKFCALWKLAGGRYLRRQPEKVVEELGEITEPFVFFADDESLVDAKRMRQMAALIREAGIKKRYFLYGRSDTIVKHPDLLEEWRDVGLEQVFVGLEFFRDEDLEYVGKGSTVRENEEAVRILHSLDIEVFPSFIVRPEFTRDDFAAFRRFCRSLGLSFAGFTTLTPLPGTDFYEEVKDRLITHDYDFFDFIHTVLPTALPLKEFYEEHHRLYRGATSFAKQFATLKRYNLKDVPHLLGVNSRYQKQLRTAYLDYQTGEGA